MVFKSSDEQPQVMSTRDDDKDRYLVKKGGSGINPGERVVVCA